MGRTKKVLIVVFVCLAVLVSSIISIALVDFYIMLENKESDLQKETLRDLALQESAIVEIKLEGYLHTLHVIAEFVREGDLLSVENVGRMKNLLICEEFHQLGIITLDGVLHTTGDHSVDIGDRAYFQDLLQGQEAISSVMDSRIGESKIFVVATPVFDVNGTVKGAVHGSVTLEDFQTREGSRLNSGGGSVYIVDQQGNYILRGQENDLSWKTSNIFEQLQIQSRDITVEKLRKQFQQDDFVLTDVFVEGVAYMACFSPISINDWYAVVMMPQSSIEEHIDFLLAGDIYALLAKILLAVGLFSVIVILFYRKEAKEQYKREREMSKRLLSGVVGFVMVDLDTEKILHCSSYGFFQQYKALDYDNFMKKTVQERVGIEYQEELLQALSVQRIRKDYQKGIGERMLEFLAYADGENAVWVECERHVEREEENGHLIVTYVLRDISEKKMDAFVWKTKAERDLLTGLYNRAAAMERIDQYLRFTTASKDQYHAFVIFDLDNFKRLNDTLGHQVGDQALKDMAAQLVNFFRRDDIVCRLGGDEYVVFLKDIAPDFFHEKISVLLEKIQLKYERDGQSIQLSASAGVATAPVHGTSFSALYRCADKALYHAKRQGKANYKLYDGHEADVPV